MQNRFTTPPVPPVLIRTGLPPYYSDGDVRQAPCQFLEMRLRVLILLHIMIFMRINHLAFPFSLIKITR